MRIFLGYDPLEDMAYRVARFSIERRSSSPTRITPIVLSDLRRADLYRRPTTSNDGQLFDVLSNAPMSTEFAISRFFIPHLIDADNESWVVFADSDIVCVEDITKILDYADDRYAVVVVKHEQRFDAGLKKVHKTQTAYPFKNWSSVMLWNVKHPAHKALTLQYLNSVPGRTLHGFDWLDRDQIGSLPLRWNHLVNIDTKIPEGGPAIWHFTLGGPWLTQWNPKTWDKIWLNELEDYERAIELPDPGWIG